MRCSELRCLSAQLPLQSLVMSPLNPTTAKSIKATARQLRGGWHPVQIQAMTILSERVASPSEIAVELGLTRAKAGYVSHYVKSLRDLGLVKLVRTTPGRGTQHFYQAITPFVISDAEAEGMTLEERLAVSSWTISCINRDFLRSIESKTIDERTDRHLTRFPLVLDEAAIEDLFAEYTAGFYRTEQIQAESAARRETSGEAGRPMSAIMASFLMPESSLRKPIEPWSEDGDAPVSPPTRQIDSALQATVRMLRSGWQPIQIQALTILSEREASPKEIAAELGLQDRIGLVGYHIGQLHARGQIELVRQVPVRGANAHFYRASAPLVLMGEDADQMTIEERMAVSCWTVACINHDFLLAVETRTIDERSDRHLTRFPLLLDEQGISDLFAEHRRIFYKTKQIQDECNARRSEASNRAVSAILASFPMPEIQSNPV